MLKKDIKILPINIADLVIKTYYYGRLAFISEKHEPEIKIISYLIREGDCVVDIGSNFGRYTKCLSTLVGKSGKVYSIEPMPSTFSILSFNISKMKLKNTLPINYAVSDKSSTVIMEVPLYEGGGENFYSARIVNQMENNSLRKIEVKAIPLDLLLSGHQYNTSFIKCDAEGHELNCVKGAYKTIKTAKPAWLIEISGNPDDKDGQAYRLFQLLETDGYIPFWYDGTSLIKRRVGDRSINYFFLNSMHISDLKNSSINILFS